MVRTFSTLFQTMMRCYSSLRAGRGHILSFFFPIPVQQVIPTDRHGFKAMKHLTQEDWEMGRERRAGNLWQNVTATAGIKKKKKAGLEMEKEIT